MLVKLKSSTAAQLFAIARISSALDEEDPACSQQMLVRPSEMFSKTRMVAPFPLPQQSKTAS
jgi:hypothetical protein